MKMFKILCIFIGIAFLVDSDAYGTILHVPDDYPTIQAAINAAVLGDIVEIADGTYKGLGNRDIDFNGKEITVRSKNGPDNCIIDCEELGRGFYLHSGETDNSIIKGLTITNGTADRGGGINIENASAEIVDCIIIDNSSTDGGGVSCRYGSINIYDTVINNNYCQYRGSGGGLNVYYSSLTMKNSFVIDNSAPYNDGGGIYLQSSSCEIVNSVIADNSSEETGGGFLFEGGSDYKVTNCTIVGNKSPNAIGAAISVLYNAHVILTNSIISNNIGNTGFDEKYCSGNSSVTLNYCNTYNNSPDGCLDITRNNCLGNPPTEGVNPLFVDSTNYDFHLTSSSPCIDAGTSEGAPDHDFEGDARAQGLGYDIGADEFYRIQNPNNGHWYQRFDNTMGWHDAKAHCENLGGYLATVTSQQEHDFVYNNLGSVSPNDCWLGCTDEVVEGEWEWITGEDWDYTRWRGGEPNNCGGDEHYLMFNTPNSWNVEDRLFAGLWNDAATQNDGTCSCSDCDELWPISTICEWDSLTQEKSIACLSDSWYAKAQDGGDENGDNISRSQTKDSLAKWELIADGSYHKIKLSGTTFYLSGEGPEGSIPNGRNVHLWTWADSDLQRWELIPDGSYYRLRCVEDDVYLSGSGEDDNIHLWGWAGSDLQRWDIQDFTPGVCEGDFDGNGVVDESDLAVFAADFGRADCSGAIDCPGDFNTDSDVDGMNLSTFNADYGRTDCP